LFIVGLTVVYVLVIVVGLIVVGVGLMVTVGHILFSFLKEVMMMMMMMMMH
jgi:hypothetical protein